MISSAKLIIFLLVGLVSAYVGWNGYQYFATISEPTLEIVGMEPNGTYAGETAVMVKGNDGYKVSRLTVKVDGSPLVNAAKIGKKKFEYPLVIATKSLTQGKHQLEVEIQNGGYVKKKAAISFEFNVNNTPLKAAFVKNEMDAKIAQGRTLHVQFQTNNELKSATLKTLSKVYPCVRESDRAFIYECFVPIETEEAPGEYLFTIEAVDLPGGTVTLNGKFQVVSFPFKRQTLRIAPEKMKEENELGLSEKEFESQVEELTRKSPPEKLWHGTFITPLEINDPKQITTEYGVIRTTQERGLKQHKALDLYATPKSVVWAPQSGRVVIKNRFAHSGNTIVIDHGYGILSLFFHLDSFADREVGELIQKGNPLGTLGKTGYATGYHLHWEMRVKNVPVDPMEWTFSSF